MRRLACCSLALALSSLLAACGPTSNPGDDDDDVPDGGTGPCTDGQDRCSGLTLQECQGGDWVTVQQCPLACDPTHGCVQCTPNLAFCDGDDVMACNGDGTIGGVLQTCQPGQCHNGACQDPCALAAQSRSYIGCEYWPVDLDNAVEVLGTNDYGTCALYTESAIAANLKVCSDPSDFLYPVKGLCDYGDTCAAGTCQTMNVCILDAQHSPFAVAVANPSTTESATVTLTNATGTTQTVTVNPGAVQSLFPQSMGFADQSIDFSSLDTKAYKLTSTRPIVAYQFNPLDNVGVFSNDASLLLPAHTFDLSYVAVTYPTLGRRPYTNDYNGYITIVATQTTTVQVTPAAAVRAGAGVPAINAGATQSFTLGAFQTLTLEAVGASGGDAWGGDLTGTQISSDQPVGVFVGHEATVISNQASPPCCADHLEDQLFPASTWGKVFALARTQSRGTGEPDLLRVVAQKPNTTITFNPAQSGCGTLAAGQFCDVFITGDVEVSSTEPILIAHYLLSTGGVEANSGDPAIAFAVPTEQFRTSYSFLVGENYSENYVSLVAPAGATVTLDGNNVSGSLATFGSGAYIGGRVSVTAGAHTLDCPQTCGVEVYGYSEAVSYLYAGGLDLEQIVVD